MRQCQPLGSGQYLGNDQHLASGQAVVNNGQY